VRFTESGLYSALEKVLREKGTAMDCVELFDIPEVRDHAASANRVSDYLGSLWRKGLCTRIPSPGGDKSRAKWMYQWKARADDSKVIPGPVIPGMEYAPKLLIDRPLLQITEEGHTIQLTTPHLTILIKTR